MQEKLSEQNTLNKWVKILSPGISELYFQNQLFNMLTCFHWKPEFRISRVWNPAKTSSSLNIGTEHFTQKEEMSSVSP